VVIEGAITDEEVVTVKDMCKVLGCDIKNSGRKEVIHHMVCLSVNIVLSDKNYKSILLKAKSQKISSTITEIFKKSSFRQDLIQVLTI